jgi:hypothetical protein
MIRAYGASEGRQRKSTHIIVSQNEKKSPVWGIYAWAHPVYSKTPVEREKRDFLPQGDAVAKRKAQGARRKAQGRA